MLNPRNLNLQNFSAYASEETRQIWLQPFSWMSFTENVCLWQSDCRQSRRWNGTFRWHVDVLSSSIWLQEGLLCNPQHAVWLAVAGGFCGILPRHAKMKDVQDLKDERYTRSKNNNHFTGFSIIVVYRWLNQGHEVLSFEDAQFKLS